MKKVLARLLRGFTQHICGDTWGHVHEHGYNWKMNKLQLEQHAGVFFRKTWLLRNIWGRQGL